MLIDVRYLNRRHLYLHIERMEIIYRAGTPDIVYFPYEDKDGDGLDNVHQSTKVSEKNGCLYIVIDPTKNVDDVYGANF